MGYCVLHCRKGKNGEGLGNHIDRTEGKEYSYRHSDSTRRYLNEDFAQDKFQKLSLNEAIDLRISEGYTGVTAIRKDAVRFVETIFSGSHEDMIKIQNNPKEFKLWKEKTIAFAKTTFGEDNIVRMSLHLDEDTPHFHCVSAPIIDGRLSAKKLLTPLSLAMFQTDYAKEMAEFGLMRGELGSEAVHNGLTEYNSKIGKEAKEELANYERQNKEIEKEIENQTDVLSKLNNSISIQKQEFVEKETKIDDLNTIIESTQSDITDYEKLEILFSQKNQLNEEYLNDLEIKKKQYENELAYVKTSYEKDFKSKTAILSNLTLEIDQLDDEIEKKTLNIVKTVEEDVLSLREKIRFDFVSKEIIQKKEERKQLYEFYNKFYQNHPLTVKIEALNKIISTKTESFKKNNKGGPKM